MEEDTIDMKEEQIVWIDVDDLGVDAYNLRGGEWTRDEEFIQDLKNNGFINPLTVRRADPSTGKKYAIVCGSQRYYAAIEASYTEVPCFIKKMDDVTAMGRSIAENKYSKSTPAWRYVVQMGRMHSMLNGNGKSREDIIREISSMTGMKRTTIQRYLDVGELPPKVIELMKPRGADGKKVLSVHVAANIATKLNGCEPDRLYEVAEHVVGMNEDTANEVIDQAKAHPDMSADDIRKVTRGEPLTRRYTVDLDADAQNALNEVCVQKQVDYQQLINRALKNFLKPTEGVQEKPATSAPEASSTSLQSAEVSAPPQIEASEPAQPAHQPPLSPEIRTYLETSGLSAEGTGKLLSNPTWLALPDNEKKPIIDNNVQTEKELAENADRMKKLEEEQEANWKRIEEEERNDPNRNPKTADPDVIFFCEDCITPFKIKHSDRESCPACHSTNIQYSDFAMSCGGGNCWRPRPLKDSLTICPCGCGFGYDDEGKWYSPAQYEGVMV
ncbi:MAG: ParB N-terminal domain-containing protein [Candidatus Methanoperedens sp.]|nr:ParB N-terminal domain-containing protein [Candidatus Methanoperedens sp.]